MLSNHELSRSIARHYHRRDRLYWNLFVLTWNARWFNPEEYESLSLREQMIDYQQVCGSMMDNVRR